MDLRQPRADPPDQPLRHRHRAAWMPDGQSLLFTSDRSGKPQLYQVPARRRKATRLTFQGGTRPCLDFLRRQEDSCWRRAPKCIVLRFWTGAVAPGRCSAASRPAAWTNRPASHQTKMLLYARRHGGTKGRAVRRLGRRPRASASSWPTAMCANRPGGRSANAESIPQDKNDAGCSGANQEASPITVSPLFQARIPP